MVSGVRCFRTMTRAATIPESPCAPQAGEEYKDAPRPR